MQKRAITASLALLLCIALFTLPRISAAQSNPPTPTPSPIPPQIVVIVTATPSATPAPTTFWEDNNQALMSALIGLVFGGILVWLLRPVIEKLGNTLADLLSRLGSGWGFKRHYLLHLIEEHRTLNIRGLRDLGAKINAVALEHVYVSLQAQAVATLRHTPPALSIGDALSRHRRLSILGNPGSI